MNKDEIQVAYELALENDKRFTEELFFENLQTFRNLPQTSAPYNISDFPVFLKKLSASKYFGILQESSGTQYAFLRDQETINQLQKLQPAEYSVYCLVETAGNKSIWSADIKRITGLSVSLMVQRITKNLSEGLRLIKPVRSIRYKNRRLYVLSHIEPADEISGGAFYYDGEFNEVLVEGMKDQVAMYLSKNMGRTLTQITDYLKSSNTIQGDLLEENVLAVVNLLVLENKVFSGILENGKCIYIWSGASDPKFAEDAFSTPCFSCNLADECRLGVQDKFCPSNCDFLSKWLGTST
ncbi:DNA-directed RNA polymerase III, putative [Theileria equi strain WA]|uniref:DNA-directed RNA polymerase III, putative n=1 Tax=Theileria equi strain WA TaxID=1537102 RepID=L1LEI6_THEEQ|nr:DNA-directed RNA polymerase III, putative [Theileria equi strain WA]EKX73665.1 DNA-directed RNA polymerase III, putative [Theileria equi strain WA]|eukprot:XP_004833117.1 DNA-directed RNA polymerase III, putative [Theileria equi strain WA]